MKMLQAKQGEVRGRDAVLRPLDLPRCDVAGCGDSEQSEERGAAGSGKEPVSRIILRPASIVHFKSWRAVTCYVKPTCHLSQSRGWNRRAGPALHSCLISELCASRPLECLVQVLASMRNT
ncbi:hypothetical protein RRG08_053589 [Elysia crispata]|uniref:Uncharacterized protein n=1 Tax=Elysia crispata TaxID=231223 RepID=A0AAE1CRC9_9GAST|nr:hypothetical protein RRG08_053589 [Elysia crispata]